MSAPITDLKVSAYKIPTSSPEADGTIDWQSTTIVIVHVTAAGKTGMGYSYAGKGAAVLIQDVLMPLMMGADAFDIPCCHHRMRVAVRNIGAPGEASCAISAVDNALWDLKAQLCDLPLVMLLGRARDAIAVYGSGGFTTYNPQQIAWQIEDWAVQGITQFKIKIGRDRNDDIQRIKAACRTMPENGILFVDANGAYNPKQALAMAEIMADYHIAWFEEPVSSDDLEGLRFVRDHAPACMEISAGEYGYRPDDFRQLLKHGAIDVLQIDATRSLGTSGFLQAASFSASYHCPVSSHCAPSLHAPLMCHIETARHIEYFYDHSRIEQLIFEGIPPVTAGSITPQMDRPGTGITLKKNDAEKYQL